jgi:hypothetical protein
MERIIPPQHVRRKSFSSDTRLVKSDDDKIKVRNILLGKKLLKRTSSSGDLKFDELFSPRNRKEEIEDSSDSSVDEEEKVDVPVVDYGDFDYESFAQRTVWEFRTSVVAIASRKQSLEAGFVDEEKEIKNRSLRVRSSLNDVFEELINTEKSYTNKLEMLNRYVIRSLLAYHEVPGEEKIVSLQMIQQIFLNVDKLWKLSSDILKDLKGIIEHSLLVNISV